MRKVEKFLDRLIVIGIIALVFLTAFQVVLGELTDWQFYLITMVIAPILAELWKLVMKYFGAKVGKFHASVAVAVISVIAAAIFGGDIFSGLPPFGDNFMAWVNAFILTLVPFIGLATIIYNLLWDRVFDRLAKRWTALSYRLEG